MFLMDAYALLLLAAAVLALGANLRMRRRRAARTRRMYRYLNQAVKRETPIEVAEESEVVAA